MTPAESEEVTKHTPGTSDNADGSSSNQQRWLILGLLVLLVAAILGIGVGAGIVLRGRSFGTPVASDLSVRPTFVVASVPSPSPSLSGSPSPASVVAGNANDQYTVEAGDTLRSIAERVYGDAAQWPRIYDANRETIGPDPDALNAGTRLRVPRS